MNREISANKYNKKFRTLNVPQNLTKSGEQKQNGLLRFKDTG